WLGFEPALALVPTAAFAGALGTAWLVRAVATARGRLAPSALLLTGVVFNAFAAAMITLINSLADFYQAHGILSWVVGSVTFRGGSWMAIAAATLIVGAVVLAASARDLNALGTGEESAATLGVNVGAVHRRVYLATALLIAGAVPVSGMIGFVG